MTPADFDRLTPEEFGAIYESWYKSGESDVRRSWEQTRFLGMCMLAPYSSNKLNPRDVLPLPWDDEEQTQQNQQQRPSRAESLARMRQVAAARGLK